MTDYISTTIIWGIRVLELGLYWYRCRIFEGKCEVREKKRSQKRLWSLGLETNEVWDIEKILSCIYWEGKTARGQILQPPSKKKTKTSSVWWEITLGILSLFMICQLWDWLRWPQTWEHMQMAGPEACQHVEGPGEGRRGGASAAEEQKGGVEEDRSALHMLSTRQM